MQDRRTNSVAFGERRYSDARRPGGSPSTEQVAAAIEAANSDDFAASVYGVLVTTGAFDNVHVTNLASTPPARDGEPFDVGAGLRRVSIAYAVLSDAITSRLPGPGGSV